MCEQNRKRWQWKFDLHLLEIQVGRNQIALISFNVPFLYHQISSKSIQSEQFLYAVTQTGSIIFVDVPEVAHCCHLVCLLHCKCICHSVELTPISIVASETVLSMSRNLTCP